MAMEKYADLWGLSNLEKIDVDSVNQLFSCASQKYGPCVLKIGKKPEFVKNECNALYEYNGKHFCKIYEADISNGVLLVERITPGTHLRDVSDLDKRLDLFYKISHELHIKPDDEAIYSTYLDWVTRITEFMRNHKEHGFLYEKMAAAESICRDLWEEYPNKMLLHGDLHHDNILFDAAGNYRIIDPKGVVGDRVFDIPHFILNEFDEKWDDEKIVYITKALSEKFGIPEFDIRRLTYVEMCMANCWSVESAEEPNIDDVLFAEKMMNELL